MKVPSAIAITVKMSAFLRPYLSPKCPITMAPIGRMRNPTP